MVALSTIRASNALLKEAGEGLVAVFLGATSGIGQAALKQFVENTVNPRVYIVARNEGAITSFIEELKGKNPGGKYEVVQKNVSLVKEATEVAEFVKSKETKVDVLFLSVGFLSLDGRQETTEGLEASLTTRYYSRLRVTQLLIPLLKASSSPHVVNVLGAGQEGPINEKDFSLSDPKNFSVIASNNHSGTFLTLSLEHLARENPTVSFVHTYPGLVSTPLLGNMSKGIFLGTLFRWVIAPLLGLFATSPTEAGERGLFYATSARYSVDNGLVPLQEGVEKAKATKGVFLVDAKGDSTDSEKVLGDLRKRGIDDKIWEHTAEVFASVHAL